MHRTSYLLQYSDNRKQKFLQKHKQSRYAQCQEFSIVCSKRLRQYFTKHDQRHRHQSRRYSDSYHGIHFYDRRHRQRKLCCKGSSYGRQQTQQYRSRNQKRIYIILYMLQTTCARFVLSDQGLDLVLRYRKYSYLTTRDESR